MGARAGVMSAGLVAGLIALSPQALLISGWFNTLLLGHWLIAAFAVACLYVSHRSQNALFLCVAPLSMMAYSTYPLLLFAVLLTRDKARRSGQEIVGLFGLLGVSLVLGILLMNGVNLVAHGHFGIDIAEWREPAPAQSVGAFVENVLGGLPWFFERFFAANGFGVFTISAANAGLLVVALWALRRDWFAGYVVLGMGVAVGLLLVHGAKEGVDVPVRALISVWVLFALLLGRFIFETLPERAAVGCLIVLLAVFFGQTFKHALGLQSWQTTTRDLAAALDPSEPVALVGPFERIHGFDGANIMNRYALVFRLRQLGAVRVVDCGDSACGAEFLGQTLRF